MLDLTNEHPDALRGALSFQLTQASAAFREGRYAEEREHLDEAGRIACALCPAEPVALDLCEACVEVVTSDAGETVGGAYFEVCGVEVRRIGRTG